MMASAFSQLTDTATSIAWQLTLSLLHVLWHGSFAFGLLSDSPEHVLTADGSWHVSEVDIQDDDFGHRNIRVKLDQLGGRHMQRLSKTCLAQQLAIIVNGVVISASIVRSEIGREFVIIDVGVKGELRKKQTVRVGSGETKTITIDLAEATD